MTTRVQAKDKVDIQSRDTRVHGSVIRQDALKLIGEANVEVFGQRTTESALQQ